MPTPINTKRGRGEGRLGPGAPTTWWPCGWFPGCGVSLLPAGLRARVGSSPRGTGIAGWENTSKQGAFWIGLWKPEGFQAEPQRSLMPAPRAQIPSLLCPHWSCHHASCPQRQLMLTGHQPLCSTAVLHVSWPQGASLSVCLGSVLGCGRDLPNPCSLA